jgi:hypothetical protein
MSTPNLTVTTQAHKNYRLGRAVYPRSRHITTKLRETAQRLSDTLQLVVVVPNFNFTGMSIDIDYVVG